MGKESVKHDQRRDRLRVGPTLEKYKSKRFIGKNKNINTCWEWKRPVWKIRKFLSVKIQNTKANGSLLPPIRKPIHASQPEQHRHQKWTVTENCCKEQQNLCVKDCSAFWLCLIITMALPFTQANNRGFSTPMRLQWYPAQTLLPAHSSCPVATLGGSALVLTKPRNSRLQQKCSVCKLAAAVLRQTELWWFCLIIHCGRHCGQLCPTRKHDNAPKEERDSQAWLHMDHKTKLFTNIERRNRFRKRRTYSEIDAVTTVSYSMLHRNLRTCIFTIWINPGPCGSAASMPSSFIQLWTPLSALKP